MKIIDLLNIIKSWNIDYVFNGNENIEINGFSDPQDYQLNTAIWIGKIEDIKLKNNISYCDIGLCIMKFDLIADVYPPNIIRCESPKQLFSKLVLYYYKKDVISFIDKTANISSKSILGNNCYIGRNVCIEDNVMIGNNCKICDNTYLGRGTILGDNCCIGENSIIGGETNGSAFIDLDSIMKSMPNVGIVKIGNYVEVGAGSIICKGTFGETTIGDECMLNAGSCVGHNCKIGKRVFLLGRCTISGNTIIGDGSQLISALVKNRIIIGKNVKIGIGSVVIKDIPDESICFGNPARILPSIQKEDI